MMAKQHKLNLTILLFLSSICTAQFAGAQQVDSGLTSGLKQSSAQQEVRLDPPLERSPSFSSESFPAGTYLIAQGSTKPPKTGADEDGAKKQPRKNTTTTPPNPAATGPTLDLDQIAYTKDVPPAWNAEPNWMLILVRWAAVGVPVGVVAALGIALVVQMSTQSRRGPKPNVRMIFLVVFGVVALGATVFLAVNEKNLGTIFPFLKQYLTTPEMLSRKFCQIHSQKLHFTISLPQPVYFEKIRIQDLVADSLRYQEDHRGAYILNYGKMSSPNAILQKKFDLTSLATAGLKEANIQEILDAAVEESIDRIHAHPTFKSQITLGKAFWGREAEGRLPENAGVFIERIYLANDCYFQQLIVGTQDFVRSMDARIFLDSLLVTVPPKATK